MVPTVYDICVKDVVSIDINKTLEDAIQKMAIAKTRTIILQNKEENSYHILTTMHLLEFKLNNIDKKTTLSKLHIPKAKILDKNLNLLTVLNHIESSDEYMVIVENNKLIGVVSYTDIINNIDPQLMMKKQTISSLINQYKAVITDKDTTTFDAITLLKDNSRDAILILDEEYKAIGIFTSKDLIDLLRYDRDLTKPIKEYMNSPVETLKDDTTIADALSYMKEKKFKRIVIVNKKGRVSGLITQKELLKTFYNKWVELIKEEGYRISKTNEQLTQVASELKSKMGLDHLTQLYNRTKFDEFLNENIELFSQKEDETFCMLIIDIDDFKILNDTYGHLFGDKVLQSIAQILSDNSRASDIVARWGGEEFVIILPKTQIHQAIIFAEKIRSTIEHYDFGKPSKITCSIGISQLHNKDTKIALFKRADDALYIQSKSTW